jgi:hypothetical protein
MPKKQRSVNALFSPVEADRLGDVQDMLLVERAMKGRAALA